MLFVIATVIVLFCLLYWCIKNYKKDIYKNDAQFLAQVLCLITDKITQEAYKRAHLKSESDENRFKSEISILLINIIDRQAYACLPPDKRIGLFNSIMENFLSSQNFVDSEKFVEHYNVRAIEYRKYKDYTPSQNQGTQGTLVWEACKTIIKEYFQEGELELLLTMQMSVLNAIISMHLSEVFANIIASGMKRSLATS